MTGKWPGETCLPALGCVALMKLLPSFIGPRGDAEQLLIKTDASEAASPSPSTSFERATQVPGATSAVPQHTTAPQPLPGAVELPHRQRGGDFGGGLEGLRSSSKPQGGGKGAEGTWVRSKAALPKEAGSSRPLKFRRPVSRKRSARNKFTPKIARLGL